MSFATHGYEIRPLFSPDQVAQLRDAIGRYMDRLAQSLFKQLDEEEAGADFDQRIEILARRDQSLASLIATAVATDGHRDAEVAGLANDRALVDLAAGLAGCTIDSSTFRFRVNSPALPDSAQLWHSDVVRTSGPCSNVAATAWIALNDPDPAMGGLEIVPGQRQSPLPHSQMGGRLFIPPRRLEGLETVSPQVPAGHCLFLAPFTPHRSAPNLSSRTRWSLVIWLKGPTTLPGGSVRELLARNLKRLRRERGLTQQQLANAAGLDRAYVSALEQQRHGARIDTIEHLAAALDVESDHLIAADCVGQL